MVIGCGYVDNSFLPSLISFILSVFVGPCFCG